MNEMAGLRTEVASLWDEPVHRGPMGRKLARWAISHIDESIPENTDKKTKNYDHDHSARFQQHRTHEYGGVQPYDYFDHKREDKEDGFCDGLDINWERIKMKILVF
jgi:hypothetical protein